MSYGILATNTNTGVDSELQCIFSTPLSVISNQPAYVQDMMNLSRKANSQNIQRWEIEAKLYPTNNSANFLVHSVINGHDSIIYVRMPQVHGVTTSLSASDFRVANGWAAGVSQFQTAIWDGLGLIQAALKVGEFIKFANHSKVYLVTAISGANPNTATIFPPLKAAIVSEEVIKVSQQVTMQARYDTTVQLGIQYVDGVLSDPGSVKLIEAI